MWLIEDEEKRFITDRDDVGYAAKLLREAQRQRMLTLVVGNGPSQSAAWLHSEREKSNGSDTFASTNDVSWQGVVKRAAAKAGVKADLISKNQNNLALAQSVLVKYEDSAKDIKDARASLVSSLYDAFRREIKPTIIDEMLAKLEPSDVVTTNYDFQIERAFEQFSPMRWSAFVRHGQGRPLNDGTTWIHKMHGSFKPEASILANYRFSEKFPPDSPEESIVITESDYDVCYKEIGLADENASLMIALSKTCLIIGKGLDAQDISFMYALRKTRAARRRARQEAFMLFNGPLTATDELNLYNLGIKPLAINLPRAPKNGNYYFGLAAALARLFPDLRQLFEDAKSDPVADFSALVRGPDVVAVGLASRNITGLTEYMGNNIIPPPGRRNLRYADVEEHVGGSAMTPLMILSALNIDPRYHFSMVSAIGGENDTYGMEILRKSRDLGIDTDAVSRNQPTSWHSTVLVHSSKTHEEKDYPGQRIFLDRGYNGPVDLEKPELEQLRTQLTQPNLRIVYLDKFLAAQHPPLKYESELNPNQLGPFVRKENLECLDKALVARPQIDVVYETGGGGSPFQHVEKILSPYINVFTTGFPFFASVVLHQLGWKLPSSLQVFDPEAKWWEADFKQETKAIEECLARLIDTPVASIGRLRSYQVEGVMLNEAGRWAGRVSGNNNFRRRWFVTTLHHFGALGIDLVNKIGWYCSAPNVSGTLIHNTSGAGDSFRGALLYALLSAKVSGPSALPNALLFATDVATERCRHFRIDKACERIGKAFGGRYSDYDRNAAERGLCDE